MSDDDGIFVDTDQGVGEVADRLKEVLGLELIPRQPEGDDDVGLRGRAATVDGWLGFRVHRNWHVLVDPEPGEAQAIDPYSIQVDIWYGAKDEAVQKQEAREVFDRLVAAELGVPMLLVHNVTYLIAAHLPAAGTHYFESGISMDEPDLAYWRDWVSDLRIG